MIRWLCWGILFSLIASLSVMYGSNVMSCRMMEMDAGSKRLEGLVAEDM